MLVTSSCGTSDGFAHPFDGSCDQTSTIRSVTTMAMTGLPLSCPSVRPLTTVERVDAGGPYRLRGRPIGGLLRAPPGVLMSDRAGPGPGGPADTRARATLA